MLCLGSRRGKAVHSAVTQPGTDRPSSPSRLFTGTLTRWTLLSLAPARAAASPDTELSSWLLPWAPPAGSGGGGGGVAPAGGGGTGGGGGGGGPLQERGALAADEGCPGGRVGPATQQRGLVSPPPPAPSRASLGERRDGGWSASLRGEEGLRLPLPSPLGCAWPRSGHSLRWFLSPQHSGAWPDPQYHIMPHSPELSWLRPALVSGF